MSRLVIVLTLALSGCEREPVRCAGARPLWCYCATVCEATDAGATVVHPDDCEPLCVDLRDGGTP